MGNGVARHGLSRLRVALIADSGGLYALYDRRDRHHACVRAAVENETGPIIVPAALLSEIDYLLNTKLGLAAETRFLQAIENGSFTIEQFTASDATRCR